MVLCLHFCGLSGASRALPGNTLLESERVPCATVMLACVLPACASSDAAQMALAELRNTVEILAPEGAAQEASECLEEFQAPLTAEELQAS